MRTHKLSLKAISANDRMQVKGPGVRKNRLAAPALFAALGITLGTLTGLAVAIFSAPAGATAISVVLANAESTSLGHDTVYGPTQQAHLTVLAQVARAGKCATDAGHLAANRAATGTPKAVRVSDVAHSTSSQLSSGKAPAGGKAPAPRVAFRAHHRTRRANTHLLMNPVLIVTVNDSHAGQPLLIEADEPLNLKNEIKSSNFYIEGDLNVVDYDATAGTIETSDGRTFVVGITVAASNAAPWGEYRSSLHYRCSRTGSCALSRAGAIAPNARLI
jgi:hypothetical protein